MPKINKISNAKLGTLDHCFWCPGCECGHGFKTTGPGPQWQFNGDMEKPTVTPSIKVTMPWKGKHRVCHFHITDGKIIYCADSWHDLKSKTVEMEDF